MRELHNALDRAACWWCIAAAGSCPDCEEKVSDSTIRTGQQQQEKQQQQQQQQHLSDSSNVVTVQ
jgi:hypothetical protein